MRREAPHSARGTGRREAGAAAPRDSGGPTRCTHLLARRGCAAATRGPGEILRQSFPSRRWREKLAFRYPDIRGTRLASPFAAVGVQLYLVRCCTGLAGAFGSHLINVDVIQVVGTVLG